jgi:SAM-dependent methyltransferase
LERHGSRLLAYTLTYTLTIFLSALLLFLVEPLIGKLIVPLLGGFPSVWNTCMVFFQAMLLAGYAYAHYSTRWLGGRRQAVVHIGLVALIAVPVLLFQLQVFRDLVPSSEDNVVQLVLGLLLLLLVSVGLPFFVVSATAPLLQRWFASTDHPAAKDPYFLYAASNLGSMLALFGYIVTVEPNLTLVQQRWAWSVAFALLVLLLAGCAVLFWKSPAPTAKLPEDKLPVKSLPASAAIIAAPSFRQFATDFAGPSLAVQALRPADEHIGLGRALRWVALAFVPSSLMLGVTTYITTDIAAIPLLWVLPLALYLLSFILVFSKLPALVHRFMVLALPVLLLLLIFMMVSRNSLHTTMWVLVLLHLVVLFAVAMVCHGELARDRPAARHLTHFYLLMSVGGVLGGLFNALVAPVIFTSLAEYRVAMVLAALLIPRMDESAQPAAPRTRWLDFLLPAALVFVCLEFFGVRLYHPFPLINRLLLAGDRWAGQQEGATATAIIDKLNGMAEALHISPKIFLAILRYAPPIILGYLFVERPLRFGLGVAAILFVGSVPTTFDTEHDVIFRDRSFFGVINVKQYNESFRLNGEWKTVKAHSLLHGNILHGVQFRYDVDKPDDDQYKTWRITYYHSSGPIGQVFSTFPREPGKRDVAVIGLGTGSMAAYAASGDRYTFYEIDRMVKAISFDQTTYFSFVKDAQQRGADVDIVLGDARLSLDRERETKPDQKFDLIVVDAFSSDAIPVHLMTRQALQIFRAKLKEDGIIIFHTSNRYLRLEPVVGNIAEAEGMAWLMQSDGDVTDDTPGKYASTWVVVANKEADFGKLLDDNNWNQDRRDPSVGVWTDDFSNLLRVFQWGGADN